MTEVASFDLPSPDVASGQRATTLDELETSTLTTGMLILRRLFQLAWLQLDAALVTRYRAEHPGTALPLDGSEPLTVVSRFGAVLLRRQVLADPARHTHVLPGTAALPVQEGVVTTRRLQEWACLLPQEVPFSAVARLLGWQTQEPEVLSDTTIRTLVKRHGQLLRQAEQAESAAVEHLCWPLGSSAPQAALTAPPSAGPAAQAHTLSGPMKTRMSQAASTGVFPLRRYCIWPSPNSM